MIPDAREVRFSRKEREELEARCRSARTLQRDLKRARIVLLAGEDRSTRSIAKEVGVQPRIVSLWRHRFADDGLEGLEDKPARQEADLHGGDGPAHPGAVGQASSSGVGTLSPRHSILKWLASWR